MVVCHEFVFLYPAAVQNERDRISARRPSFEESAGSALSVQVLLNAEVMSRQIDSTWVSEIADVSEVFAGGAFFG